MKGHLCRVQDLVVGNSFNFTGEKPEAPLLVVSGIAIKGNEVTILDNLDRRYLLTRDAEVVRWDDA